MAPPPKPTHLAPSQLGTKEYWEKTYTNDLSTQAQTPSHTGTTWFSDSLASTKTLSYLLSLSPPLSFTDTTFLDLGTGNGEMLFLLRERGDFKGRMLGVDYSGASIEFARRIARGKKLVEGIEFKEGDVLKLEVGEWDVVLDKGTFDAVCLSGEEVEDEDEGWGEGDGGKEGGRRRRRRRRVCEGYREQVEKLVKRGGGRFVVTSCNWTEGELRAWFEGGDGGEGEGGELVFEGRVEYPRFKFGGGTGQSVSGVCFRRR